MSRVMLVALVGLFTAGCARNRSSDEPGTRIRDTTMTAKDTTNPNDTLPHIRDSTPDTNRTDSAHTGAP
jgi:predicted component of type VI protein secretion system